MTANENLSRPQFHEYYHGTTSRERAESIRDTGLTAWSYHPDHLTLTTRRNMAQAFAGSQGAVVTVRVPHESADDYFFPSPVPRPRYRGIKQALPASMIHDIDYDYERV
jgi:hypothetical protein